MPRFAYVAKKGPEQVIQGTMEADSPDKVLAELTAMGFTPVRIREETQQAGEPVSLADRRIRSKDLAIFIRQLASLMKANVPILRAIDILHQQSANAELKRMLLEIKERIKEGNMLSDSMARFPKTFPLVFTNMIRSGELSGSLDRVLMRLADFAEKEEEIRSKVRSALAYPIFLACAGFVTVFILITFVIPRLVGLFHDLGATLPLITRILIKISYISSHYWFWGVGVAVAAGIVMRQKVFLEKERVFFDQLKLQLPLFAKLTIQSEIARLTRTLSLLYESGIPIFQAVEMAIATVDNRVIQREVSSIPAVLRGGATLGDSLRPLKNFPPFVINMVAIGEESGKLGESFAEIASFYERETDGLIKIMTTLIEPFMILVVGVIVGFIVVAMFLPIFEINVFVQ